jgi:hypothetical protein
MWERPLAAKAFCGSDVHVAMTPAAIGVAIRRNALRAIDALQILQMPAADALDAGEVAPGLHAAKAGVFQQGAHRVGLIDGSHAPAWEPVLRRSASG